MIDVFRKLRLVGNVVTSHEPISYLVLSTLITYYLERYKMGLTLKSTSQATFKYKIAENKRSICTYYQQPNAPNGRNPRTAGWRSHYQTCNPISNISYSFLETTGLSDHDALRKVKSNVQIGSIISTQRLVACAIWLLDI